LATPLSRIGILGGSFNPAHGGHRRVAVAALDRLGLDEVWLLVSPQNPLKGEHDMAPLAARLASAKAVARHPRIRARALETEFGTRFAVDTARALVRRFPAHRFVWLMGADNLAELHRWRHWRRFARTIAIAVFTRPGYGLAARGGPAMAWLRRWRHETSRDWTRWTPPGIVFIDIRLDSRSATGIRAARPDWAKT